MNTYIRSATLQNKHLNITTNKNQFIHKTKKEEVNAVNIVVQTIEGKFLVFEQEKYAIPGKTLSPVGGFIDANESKSKPPLSFYFSLLPETKSPLVPSLVCNNHKS